jgi:hypothetical protein
MQNTPPTRCGNSSTCHRSIEHKIGEKKMNKAAPMSEPANGASVRDAGGSGAYFYPQPKQDIGESRSS